VKLAQTTKDNKIIPIEAQRETKTVKKTKVILDRAPQVMLRMVLKIKINLETMETRTITRTPRAN